MAITFSNHFLALIAKIIKKCTYGQKQVHEVTYIIEHVTSSRKTGRLIYDKWFDISPLLYTNVCPT